MQELVLEIAAQRFLIKNLLVLRHIHIKFLSSNGLSGEN